MMSSRCTRRRNVGRDANGWPVAVDDGMWRRSRKRRRHALSIAFQLMPQHFDLPTHVLVALLKRDNEVDGYEGCSASGVVECFVPIAVPLLRISHLLAFIPRSAGSWSRNSSNSSFISFRRLRSASLCDIRSSGDREYGVEPGAFSEAWADDDASSGFALPPDVPPLLADWSGLRTREGGRERDLRARVGPVEGGVGFVDRRPGHRRF